MCDCIRRVDESLAGVGAQLHIGFRLNDNTLEGFPLLQTRKVGSSKQKTPVVYAYFCPFCGQRLYPGFAPNFAAQLAFEMADDLAVSSLEEYFQQCDFWQEDSFDVDPRSYADTRQLTLPDFGDQLGVRYACQVVMYLAWRGLLEQHPTDPYLVRFKKPEAV